MWVLALALAMESDLAMGFELRVESAMLCRSSEETCESGWVLPPDQNSLQRSLLEGC